MKVELQTKITVTKVAAFAELAFVERRPELGMICRAARSSEEGLTPDMVLDSLPGLSARGARNIAGWCARLGLCDSSRHLTDLGLETAESDEAAIPEQGVYDLWMVKHPLLGARIIHVERLAPRQDVRFDQIHPLPFVPERGRLFRSLVEPAQVVVLRGFPRAHGRPRCLPRHDDSRISLHWSWNMEQGTDRWTLRGDLDLGRKPPSIQHDGEIAGIDVWERFARIAGQLPENHSWDAAGHRLVLPFDDVSRNEIESFERIVKMTNVRVPEAGTFSKMVASAVPIGPRSDDDAQRWAEARLERRLKQAFSYRTTGEIRSLWDGVVAETPLERRSPSLPSHSALLASLADGPSRPAFWSIAAPVDLSPREGATQQLGGA